METKLKALSLNFKDLHLSTEPAALRDQLHLLYHSAREIRYQLLLLKRRDSSQLDELCYNFLQHLDQLFAQPDRLQEVYQRLNEIHAVEELCRGIFYRLEAFLLLLRASAA